ncbi:MAG: FtsW/RodA/SpoVE family cell cycle protein [Phycisphaerales bacterium]|nr:FtsW/RodA/SpoVE family cell cycle protein [Phycisphaerales bacterium]
MDLQRLRSLVGTELTFTHFAWLTVAASLALSLIGVYAIDVATSPDLNDAAILSFSGLVKKQLAFLMVGVMAAVAVAIPHYRFVRYFAWPVMWLVLCLLVFLLIPAVPTSIVKPVNGARAWINLGPISFQPAEVAKIAFIIVLADYLRWRSNHRTLKGLIPPAIIAFIPVGLILLQPDLGTATLFIPTLFVMLLAAGAKLKHLSAVVVIACLAGPAAFPILKPHQQKRILGLISMIQGSDAGADDINYQSITARTVAGAGQVVGQTDAKARAIVHFSYLPERHNDMVFAVIVSRFGFLGGVVVLGLYALWFAGALLTAAICREPFGRLVAVGCTSLVAAQMFMNVGMNLGVLPIVGLTLPFVSYGGSSMLSVWIMTGLIVNIATRRSRRMTRKSFEFDE